MVTAPLAALAAALSLLAPASAANRPVPLALEEILTVRDGTVSLSPKVESLAGKRVKVRGWLVVFEEKAEDGFWLARRPLFQDESGAGSGDLPPTALHVIAPARVLQALPPDSVPLEVIGRVELGRVDDTEGRPSRVRVIVESPRDVLRLARPRR